MSSQRKKRVLIIKFGGLGDFILSLNAMNYIKNHHRNDELLILTENSFRVLAEKSRLFNKIVTIERKIFYFLDKIQIKKKIELESIDIIYDLQTSKRTSSYYKTFKSKSTQWSGIVENEPFYHSNINRDNMHTHDRQKDQLLKANILEFKEPDYKWLFEKCKKNTFSRPYVLIVPGGSAKRKYKRIPKDFFIKICDEFSKKSITPILIGSDDELDLCETISRKSINVINKCKKLDVLQIASMSKKALWVIGNDTGLMHLCALSGVKTIVLFTKFSNPSLCSPRGKKVKIIFYNNNEDELSDKIIKLIT